MMVIKNKLSEWIQMDNFFYTVYHVVALMLSYTNFSIYIHGLDTAMF